MAARAAETAVLRGDALGPLHGLPLGVKDLQDTEGLLTTYGNVGYRHHVPARDNGLVTRLKRAGAKEIHLRISCPPTRHPCC